MEDQLFWSFSLGDVVPGNLILWPLAGETAALGMAVFVQQEEGE